MGAKTPEANGTDALGQVGFHFHRTTTVQCMPGGTKVPCTTA